MSREPQAEPEI